MWWKNQVQALRMYIEPSKSVPALWHEKKKNVPQVKRKANYNDMLICFMSTWNPAYWAMLKMKNGQEKPQESTMFTWKGIYSPSVVLQAALSWILLRQQEIRLPHLVQYKYGLINQNKNDNDYDNRKNNNNNINK